MGKYHKMPKVETIEKNQVAKSNSLVRASYKFSLMEQRIILAFISMVDSTKKVNPSDKYLIDIDQIKELFYEDKQEKNVYADVKRAAKKLLTRAIYLEYSDNTGEGFQWVSKAIWDNKNRELWIKFHEDIIPFISSLSKRFTSYGLKEICSFSRSFSIRFFELITSWYKEETWKPQNQNKCYSGVITKKITIKELKEILQLEKRYKEITRFKKYVLNPAMAEINKKTRFKVSYELIRKGRPYHWIEFTFSEKECFKEGRIKGKTSSSLSETEGELEKDCLIKELKTETQRLQKIISSGTQTENPSLKIDAYFRQSERFKRAWKLIFEKYGLDLHTFLEGFYTRSTNFENVKHFRNTLKKYLISCLKNEISDISNDEINKELDKHLN